MILDHNGKQVESQEHLKQQEEGRKIANSAVMPLFQQGYTVEQLDFIARTIIMTVATNLSPPKAALYAERSLSLLAKQLDQLLNAKAAEAKIAANLAAANGGRVAQ